MKESLKQAWERRPREVQGLESRSRSKYASHNALRGFEGGTWAKHHAPQLQKRKQRSGLSLRTGRQKDWELLCSREKLWPWTMKYYLSFHSPTPHQYFFLEFVCSRRECFSCQKREIIDKRKENEVAATTDVRAVSKSLRG